MSQENKIFSSIEADLDSTLVKHILQENSKKDGVLPQLHSKIGVDWIKETSSNTTSIKLKGDYKQITEAHGYLSKVANGKSVENAASKKGSSSENKSESKSTKEKKEGVEMNKSSKKEKDTKKDTKENPEKDKNATKGSDKKETKANKTSKDKKEKDKTKESKEKDKTKESKEKDTATAKTSDKKAAKATKTEPDNNEKASDATEKAKENTESNKSTTKSSETKGAKATEIVQDSKEDKTTTQITEQKDVKPTEIVQENRETRHELKLPQLTVEETKRSKSPLVKEVNLVLQPIQKLPRRDPIKKEMNLVLKYGKDSTKSTRPTETELIVEPDIMTYVTNACRSKVERIEKQHRVLLFWEDGSNTVTFRPNIPFHDVNIQKSVEAFKALYDEASTELTCSKIDRLNHGMTVTNAKKECEKLQEMFPKVYIKEIKGNIYLYGKVHDVEEVKTYLQRQHGYKKTNWVIGRRQSNNDNTSERLDNFRGLERGHQIQGSLPRHTVRPELEKRYAIRPQIDERLGVRPEVEKRNYKFPLRREAPISLNARLASDSKQRTTRFPRKKETHHNLKGVVSCRQIGLAHRMYFEILTSLDTKISIYQGDVIKECVDVIVNETNDRLKLSGELSWALAQYGGNDIEADCRRYIATHGRLTATQVVPTSAGQLPSKHILHAVVPHWVSAEPRQSKMLLYKTYENIFKCAAKMRVTSIALSLQTSGSTGIPKDVYAETLFQALVTFLKTYGPLLRDIRMVNPSHRTVSTFIDAFKTKMPLVNFVAESRMVEKWH
ncbi:PREDICTED: uncharacterized protein LOC109478047 [Branchiostoma belcheri]|uniref:Uncharacterized protein LOC109478047 n=1 Tax=Branchiostoma belcheri TaxID=7741 RepID=A0A6P4ZEE0_BRABE|nr:PREDICTED: uncharacterized protein LOC109478047 [Branchiostoma belcheri]